MSAGGLSPPPCTPCCAPKRTTPGPRQHTCNPRMAFTCTYTRAATLPPTDQIQALNTCSTNHNAPSNDLPPGAGPPPPCPHTIRHTQHRCGTQEHNRHHRHACQHEHIASPHAPTPPSIHRYRQPPTTACPFCVRLREFDWSPSSSAPLVPCSCWACVWERVVAPVFGCPPEGSEFPAGVGLGFPQDWSAFLSLSGSRSEPPRPSLPLPPWPLPWPLDLPLPLSLSALPLPLPLPLPFSVLSFAERRCLW